MAKDFSGWFKIKSDIQNNKIRPFFREQEIWSTATGLNIGDEEDGKNDYYLRPFLIIKKFNNHLFWGVHLTKRIKFGEYYHPFSFRTDVQSAAVLSQLRIIDSKRLQYKMGNINSSDFELIKEKLRTFLS